MLKIRRPLGRLIFNMGIAIPGKTVFLIETAPWREVIDMDRLALGLTETHTSNRNAWNGRLRSAVRLGPPLYYGLIKSSINDDEGKPYNFDILIQMQTNFPELEVCCTNDKHYDNDMSMHFATFYESSISVSSVMGDHCSFQRRQNICCLVSDNWIY